MFITVRNRSAGTVGYEIPELNIKRTFALHETKEELIDERELRLLLQQRGGDILLRHYLVVEDEEWAEKNLDIDNMPEYFWGIEEVKNCLLNESLELLEDTLLNAPRGVIGIMKEIAWRLPLADLNKIALIKKITGFDIQAATINMAQLDSPPAVAVTGRLRKREA